MRALTSVLSLLVLALVGCAGRPTQGDPPPQPAPHDNLNALLWMQTAEEYRLSSLGLYRAATLQLDQALAAPAWDALTAEDRDTPAEGKPPAVIVDIDETVLDNTPFQARLMRDHATYNEANWRDWVKEEAAQPIPGALAFTHAAAAKGVKVFYVSNRLAELAPHTLGNLRKAGFPVVDDDQLLSPDFPVENCTRHGSDKGCRRRHIGRSHRVLMQAGDQLGDLLSIGANTPSGRAQAVAPYRDWIGLRWFVLANPSYGSWEPALFERDSGHTEAERRAQKQEFLRYK